MSYYNFDDVMAKFDDIEKKLDDLIALRDEENNTEIHSFQLNNRFCTVFQTPGGTFGIKMKIDGKTVGKELFPGKSESYVEDAAENFVHGIKNV